MEKVNLLEKIYDRMNREYPNVLGVEAEKDLAKILKGWDEYDVTETRVGETGLPVEEEVEALVDDMMLERSNYLYSTQHHTTGNKLFSELNETPTASEYFKKIINIILW